MVGEAIIRGVPALGLPKIKKLTHLQAAFSLHRYDLQGKQLDSLV
jgi:hypothetical protein